MDPKASAKSKRSHSQHGRRTHQLPPAAPAAAQKKKAAEHGGGGGAGGGGEQRPRRTHSHALPSNWDRYGDEEDDAEASTGAERDREAAPKSKGADFGFLLEQARAQPLDRGPHSSLDEFPIDIRHGVSSLLSVRGKSLLSWCENDNFIIDDEPASSFEVPFLPMDLHTLAAQLSKLKKSEWLFIEADLLPEEQAVDEPENGKPPEQSETTKISESNQCLGPPPVFDGSKLEKNRYNLSDSSISLAYPDVSRSQASTTKIMEQTPTISSNPVENFVQRENEEAVWQPSQPSSTDPKLDNTSRFEAAKAEAELDMLLDSLGDVSLSSPSDSTIHSATSASSTRDVSAAMKTAPSSLSYVATSALDDAIDDLLAETSIQLEDGKHTTLTRKEGAPSVNLPPHSSTAALKPMDDFDSWLDTL